MLLVEGYSEAGIFRYSSNRVFGVRKFKNTSAMRVFCSFENVQNIILISKIQRKIKKKCFVSEIIASENVAINCFC